MPPTKVIEPHREPTHPAVIPRHFGEGQRLPHLPLIPQATSPIMPFDDAGINLLIAQQGQHMFQPRFAIEHADFDPLNPTPFIVFFHLPIGQALGPAQDGTTRPTAGAVGRGRIPTSKGFKDGGLIALIGIGEDHGQMPWPETPFGIVHQSLGLLVGPFAHNKGDHQLAIRSNGGMIPHVAGLCRVVVAAALLLFFTKLHCSSNSSARWVRPWTCWSWKCVAWRPVTRNRRATVSLATFTSRAVALTLQPSPRWLMTSSAVASGSLVLNKALPRRSENSSPQVRQRKRRMRSWP